MTTNCMSHGAVSRLALGGKEFGFTLFQDMSVRRLVDSSSQVIDGSLDPRSENMLGGIKNVRFRVILEPGPADLITLLPLIGLAGPTGSPSVLFTTGNVVPEFDTIVDRVETVDTYEDCKVDMAVLQGQKGSSPIRLILECVGKDITQGAAGSFTATAMNTPAPFAFTQGVLTVTAEAKQFNQFALAINNNILDEHNNSVTATCIEAGARQLTLSASTPYNAATLPLFSTPWNPASSVRTTGSLAFTNGTISTSFAFGQLAAIARPPARITKMTEIRLPLTYLIGRVGSTAAITVTNDSTV